MNVYATFGTAIYNKMSGSSDLTTLLGGTAIYFNQAPDNTDPPFVIWNFQSAVDQNITPSRMWNTIVNIRAFCNNPSQAGSVDAYIDALFGGASLSMDGWNNFFTVRELHFSDVVTLPNSQKSWVTGGFYRIRIGQ